MQFDRLKRREFITLIGGAAAWPVAVRAQQPGKLPTIGFLGTTSASGWRPWSAAFVQRLKVIEARPANPNRPCDLLGRQLAGQAKLEQMHMYNC